MSMIKPGKSLDDVKPVKTVDHASTHTTIDGATKHYMSLREKLICEAFDKHFGVEGWSPETIKEFIKMKVYPDHTEYFVGDQMILKLGKLKVTIPGKIHFANIKATIT